MVQKIVDLPKLPPFIVVEFLFGLVNKIFFLNAFGNTIKKKKFVLRKEKNDKEIANGRRD